MSGVARAMVFDGPGKPLRPVEVPLPTPGPGEVLVRIEMCTLCGSDLHTYFGRRSGSTPVVLGHEIVGRVEALPPGESPTDCLGQPLFVGEPVVWAIVVSCGRCYYCQRNLPQKCENGSKYGHSSFESWPLSGGLATHCLLKRGTTVFGVPPGVEPRAACPAGCATATVAAAFELFGDSPEATIVVFGAGMLGLTASAIGQAEWSCNVIVVDPSPTRRKLAMGFGATVAVPPNELAETVRRLTDGRGADFLLELSGVPDAIKASIEQSRIGGIIAWVGSVFPSPPVTVGPEQMVRRHLTIAGIHNYRSRDLGTALKVLADSGRRFPFADLVSATFPLDRADDAFHAAATGEHVRVAVVP